MVRYKFIYWLIDWSRPPPSYGPGNNTQKCEDYWLCTYRWCRVQTCRQLFANFTSSSSAASVSGCRGSGIISADYRDYRSPFTRTYATASTDYRRSRSYDYANYRRVGAGRRATSYPVTWPEPEVMMSATTMTSRYARTPRRMHAVAVLSV